MKCLIKTRQERKRKQVRAMNKKQLQTWSMLPKNINNKTLMMNV